MGEKWLSLKFSLKSTSIISKHALAASVDILEILLPGRLSGEGSQELLHSPKYWLNVVNKHALDTECVPSTYLLGAFSSLHPSFFCFL